MKILRIIGSLDPKNGGPVIASIAQSIEMANRGHSIDYVTSDPGGRPYFPKHLGISVLSFGPSIGLYGYNTKLIPWLIQHANDYDLIIVHGIWQFHSLATWLASRKTSFKYYIYTHGMLDPWFKFHFPLKQIKKFIYWHLFEKQVLLGAAGILYTSEEEKKLAHESFVFANSNERVVKYGVPPPPRNTEKAKADFLDEFPCLQNKRLILFMGRIHPKKGCDLLVDAFMEISNLYPNLTLVMAGPIQGKWGSELMKRTESLSKSNSIVWLGALNQKQKWGAYRSAEVFILPSHSENFGVAVAEALACSLPVLITNKVNIWQKIKNHNAGLISADNKLGIMNLLKEWLQTDEATKMTMRLNAHRCFLENFEIDNVVTETLNDLQDILGKSQ